MKKILFSALIMTLLVVSMSAQKFGYLNSRALLTQMPEMETASAELEVLAKQLQKQGEGMVADLETKYAALEKRIQAGELSQVQQQEEGAKFQAQQEQLGLFEKEMTLKLQKKEAELLEPVLAKINDAITAVAKENSFQFIFDQSTQVVLFAEESMDVTSMVKAKLGM